MIVNKPRILPLDAKAGKFAVNLQFFWEGQTAIEQIIPGLANNGQYGPGILDPFDALSLSSNLALPPFRCAVGTVDFNRSLGALPTFFGPLFIGLPDTGELYCIVDTFNVAAAGTGNVGIVRPQKSFILPIYSNSRIVNFWKMTDADAVMEGSASITLFTSDEPYPALMAGI